MVARNDLPDRTSVSAGRDGDALARGRRAGRQRQAVHPVLLGVDARRERPIRLEREPGDGRRPWPARPIVHEQRDPVVRQGPDAPGDREPRPCHRPRRRLEPGADDPEVVRAQAQRQLGAGACVGAIAGIPVERGVRDPLRGPVDRQVDRAHLAADPERARQPARREDTRRPIVVRVESLRPVVAVADGDEVRLAPAAPGGLLGRRPAPGRRREEPDGDAPRVPQHHVRGVGDGGVRSRPPRAPSGRRPGCAYRRRRRRATSGGASRRRRSERRRPARGGPRAATRTASRSARRRAGSTRAARRRRA